MNKGKLAICLSTFFLLIGLTSFAASSYGAELTDTSTASHLVDPAGPDARADHVEGSQELRYSVFANKAGLKFDDRVQRDLLPEFKTIGGLPETFTNARGGRPVFDTWHRSHGDDSSSKYSRLDQINRETVKLLKPAWVHHFEGKWQRNVETNPVIAERSLFVTSTDDFVVSLDATTGAEQWRVKIIGAARRGLLWWPGNQTTAARLFVPSTNGTFALDPSSGSRIMTFGSEGRVGAGSLIAPVVDGDRLVVATTLPSVEAYSALSGELLWKTDLLNRNESSAAASAEKITGPGRIGGGVPWAGMSLDNTRSRLYVSTGNPRPALYGVTRPGNNEWSSSIVAIDTHTGEIAWSFQEVAHDLWDLDIPSPPILTSIRRNERVIDVVAAVTKIGNTILLERDSGKPVFDYRLKKAPVSQLPYETTAPYQPAVELPEPFTKRIFERSDITDLSSSQKRSVELKTANAKFGFFEPPSIESKVALFGLHGGAEWPGGAVNPETGVLFVPSNQFPWMLRLRYVETVDNTIRTVDPIGDALYQQKCAGCHGVKREGYYESEFTGDKSYPSLVGITSYLKSWGLKEFEERHALTPFSVDATDLNRIATYLHEADILSEAKGNLSIEGVWQLLLDGEGYPGSKPPWGSISAINLNTGKKLWQVPFGEYDGLTKRGIPITGQPNFGGLLVSRGGLIFATGTIDKKVRAFHSDTGEQLWQYELPAAGSAPPSTYEIDGTQYLAVVATGGLFAGFKERSDAILAFKLSP